MELPSLGTLVSSRDGRLGDLAVPRLLARSASLLSGVMLALALRAPACNSQQSPPGADTVSGSDSRTVAPLQLPGITTVIIPDSLGPAPIFDLSDLLAARSPSLSVRHRDGVSGSTATMRIRGARTISFAKDPLVIVDGILANVSADPRISLPGGSPFALDWSSWLDDLAPADIERVEILAGPATASRFGAGAANGVVLVTTKGGRPGHARTAVHASFGTIQETTEFPASFDQLGLGSDGEPMHYCTLLSQSSGECAAIADSLLVSNALEWHSPFESGVRREVGATTSLGTERARIFASGGLLQETGVLDFNTLRRGHALAHGQLDIVPSLRLGVRAGFTDGAHSGSAPGFGDDMLRSGLEGGPAQPDGYRVAPDSVRQLVARIDTRRLMAGADARWKPIRWLGVTASYGIDRGRRAGILEVGASPGSRHTISTSSNVESSTARSEVTASWHDGRPLEYSSTVGMERVAYSRTLSGRFEEGNAENSLTAASWTRQRYSLTGTFAQLDLTWMKRVTLTTGLRHDALSEFGTAISAATYPSVVLSWMVSSEPWFPADRGVGQLRLHAAYGEAGQSLLPEDVDILPWMRGRERSRETELGVDATLAGGRASLALDYFRAMNDVPYVTGGISYPPPPPPGVYTVRNSGIEATLTAELLDRRAVGARITVMGALAHNRVTSGPSSSPMIYLPDGQYQMLAIGFPINGYWAPPILGYKDLNGDGLIGSDGCAAEVFPTAASCEVSIGALQYVGSPTPTRSLSIRTDVSYRDRFTIAALFDYRGGQKLFNRTEMVRCSSRRVCRASEDRRTPPWLQARETADVLGSPAGYIEDASYWKFREISLGVTAPSSWATGLGARRLTFTLAARNLATWSPYSGPDPEANAAWSESLGVYDSFGQPAVRYLVTRMGIIW